MTFSEKSRRIGGAFVGGPLDHERSVGALEELERIHRNEVAAARHRGIIAAELATTEIMRAMNADLERVLSPGRSRS